MINNKTLALFLLLLPVAILLVLSFHAKGQPTGTSIMFNTTDIAPTPSPDNRTDPGGSITTINIDALQQNPRWKAYVGNVSGSLTLDDSGGDTIFSWALDPEDITGEVYSSRTDSITWNLVECASIATIESEEAFLGMTSGSPDTINRTFNETTHQAISVGTQNILEDTCRATSTYVNSAAQNQATADFQLVLIHDTSNLIYVTPINPNTEGYDSSIFDFQMILANDPGDTTTYYFFVELG